MEISFGELTLLKYSFGLIGYESKVGGRRVSGEALPKRPNARMTTKTSLLYCELQFSC